MKRVSPHGAFTLVEMLVVIAIIGIITAITIPTIHGLKAGDVLLTGSRQLLDDVARARQTAISQRTTVYMVFCPSNFWSDPGYAGFANPAGPALPLAEKNKAARLLDKQVNAYNFVTLRSVGDQPGQNTARYLSTWRSMPEGAIIAPFKFNPRNFVTTVYDPPRPLSPPETNHWDVAGFEVTYEVPFPSEDAPIYKAAAKYVPMPYIAFNHLGQLVSGRDEYIPLAKGNVSYAMNADKIAQQANPALRENPSGNSTNAFMLVHIDWLTGRANIERQGVR